MRVPHTRLWQGDASGSDALIRDFLVADVFTDTPLEGNQLGIFLDGRGLSDELMLKATREMNFSETVFFEPPEHDGADARVRIFTPGGEIPFAGHPTLGSAWVLCEILGKQTVTLSTGAGPVPVELDMDDDTITFGWMSQPIPDWGSYDRTDELLDALGAARKTGALPVEWYRNGPLNVYVEIAGEDALAALEPDLQKLGRIQVNCSCFTQTRGRLDHPDVRPRPRRDGGPGHGVRGRPARGSPRQARPDRVRPGDRDPAGRAGQPPVRAVRTGRRHAGQHPAGARRRPGRRRRTRHLPAPLAARPGVDLVG